MTAVQEPPLPGTHPTPDEPAFPHLDLALTQLVAEHAATTDPGPVSEAELIDQITQLESLRNTLAALQTTRIRAFARAHAATRTAAGTVEPEKLHRGITAQIAAACHTSPTRARDRLHTARDLHDLHHLRAQHAAGDLSPDAVTAVVTAASHLDPHERAELDRRLSEYELTRLGLGRLRDLARRLTAEIAPQKFRDRTEQARATRRVTLRPAPDGMTWLTAHLPVEHGVACLAALHRAHLDRSTDPAPLTRNRAQVMADTLVERVTGKTLATDIDLDVQILVPLEALIDPDSPLPAEIPGYGPVPADLLATTTGRHTWRRLITHAGIVIGGQSRRRTFTGLLADLVRLRTRNRCSEPYCDAPIRHIDHIHRDADGGRTEHPNGRGVCEFHNHVREQPGWHVERTPDGIRTTTPTGHTHLGPDP